MRQGDECWPVVFPGSNCLGQRRLASTSQVVPLRVRTDEQSEIYCRQQRKKPRVPERGTLRTGRFVATAAVDSRIAETHRHDGNSCFVIKGVVIDLQPLAEAFSGPIVPRNARLMHPCTRSLADDQQPRAGGHTQYRPRSMGQMGFAMPASPRRRYNLGQGLRRDSRHSYHLCSSMRSTKTGTSLVAGP